MPEEKVLFTALLSETDQGYSHYAVTLDNPKWLRGEEASKRPYLIDPDTGKYDLLGKILRDMGYAERNLVGKRWPSQLIQEYGSRERIMEELKWMVTKAQSDTEKCIELITLNDDPTIDDKTRLLKMAKLLNAEGFKILLKDSQAAQQAKVEAKKKEEAPTQSTNEVTWLPVYTPSTNSNDSSWVAHTGRRRSAFIQPDPLTLADEFNDVFGDVETTEEPVE